MVKLFYYSLYYHFKNQLNSGLIYTSTHRGGEDYIFNLKGEQLKIEDVEINFYFELVKDKLRFKFQVLTPEYKKDTEMKRKIRYKLQERIKAYFKDKYKIDSKGRRGESMTACELEHDFSNIHKMDESVKILKDVYNNFENLKNFIATGKS